MLPLNEARVSSYRLISRYVLIIIIIGYVVLIAFNISHFSMLPLMALNSLYCADVPLSNYSLTSTVSTCLSTTGCNISCIFSRT